METLVVTAVREHLANANNDESSRSLDDRELLEQHVDRIVVKPDTIEIHLIQSTDSEELQESLRAGRAGEEGEKPPTLLTVPWSATTGAEVKGILHSPSEGPRATSPNREALLIAIARARSWIDDLVEGRAASFAEIAEREGKVERHIRLLAPLAFISPPIVSHIAESAMVGVRVTDLARAPSWVWARQEEWFGGRLDEEASRPGALTPQRR
jgi:hypothetical protein